MAQIQFKRVHKRYSNQLDDAVKDFNLEVHDKEFLVFVGPSGCGKSTSLRMLAGLEEITEGDIYIGDERINDYPPRDRNISMVFQNYALYPNMSVYDNIAFGLQLRKIAKHQIDLDVKQVARTLGIEGLLDRRPNELSGGQRQRVALGRAIARIPDVFLMDEPLSNLDAKLRVQMRAEIISLHRKIGVTTIYVTHDQIEAMTMGDRIVVMDRGVIQQVDTPENIYFKPKNMFVAGFIGTPPINFIQGTIEEGKTLEFHTNRFVLSIPEQQAQAIRNKRHVGRATVLGIRPEHISFAQPEEQGEAFAEIQGQQLYSEFIGSDRYHYVDISTNQHLIIRAEPFHHNESNRNVTIYPNMKHALFFNQHTGDLLNE